MNISFASDIIKKPKEVRIQYGGKIITIPYGEELSTLIDIVAELSKRIQKLEKEIENIKTQSIFIYELPEKEAEMKIKRFILEKKEKGEMVFDDLEIMEKLKIPLEQVDRILEKLEKEGVIRERKNF